MAKTPRGSRNTPGRPSRNAPSGRNAPGGKPNMKPNIPKSIKDDLAYAKQALATSYGSSSIGVSTQNASMKAVMDYYANLPRAQRTKALYDLSQRIKNRDLSNWSGDPGQIVLFGELDTGARLAYATNDPRRNPALGGVAAMPEEMAAAAASGAAAFATGVSGETQQFIKEMGQSQYAAGEAEGGSTKDNTKRKRRKAQTKKLVKRTVKKTNVKGKAVRRALRSPGVTKSDKKVYAKVAKQATPKLSSRLRAADRRRSAKRK